MKVRLQRITSIYLEIEVPEDQDWTKFDLENQDWTDHYEGDEYIVWADNDQDNELYSVTTFV